MFELFPIVAGGVIALLIQPIARPRQRILALIVLSVLAGCTASFVSGELFVSWDFLLVDIPLVLIAAICVRWLLARWQSTPSVQ